MIPEVNRVGGTSVQCLHTIHTVYIYCIPNEQSELIDLRSINWVYAKKSSIQRNPSVKQQIAFYIPLQIEHKVKGFAGYLTIKDHRIALSTDLDLHLRPDNCISFTGKVRSLTRIRTACTTNASKSPAKFLGEVISTNCLFIKSSLQYVLKKSKLL